MEEESTSKFEMNIDWKRKKEKWRKGRNIEIIDPRGRFKRGKKKESGGRVFSLLRSRSRSRSHAIGRASERSALGSRNFKIAARPRKANRRGTRAREVRRIDPIRWADIGNRPDARRRSRRNQGFVRQQWNDTGCLRSAVYPLAFILYLHSRTSRFYFSLWTVQNSTTALLDRWIPAFRSLLFFFFSIDFPSSSCGIKFASVFLFFFFFY